MCKFLIYNNKFEIFMIYKVLKIKMINEKIVNNHKCDV